MGAERMFEEVAKQVNDALPVGASSHRALLEQMGLDIPNTRPALLSPDTLHQVNTYQAFRHIVIHRYGFELQPDRIATLVTQWVDGYALLTQEIQTFCQFLMAVDPSLSSG